MPRARARNDPPGFQRTPTFTYDELSECTRISGTFNPLSPTVALTFINVTTLSTLSSSPSASLLVLDVPLSVLGRKLPSSRLRRIVKQHGMRTTKKTCLADLVDFSETHSCSAVCSTLYSVFSVVSVLHRPGSVPRVEKINPPGYLKPVEFNFVYPGIYEKLDMIRQWTDRISAANLYEKPCGVCARISLLKNMHVYPIDSASFSLLASNDTEISRRARTCPEDPVVAIEGPLLCSAAVFSGMQGKQMVRVCTDCHECLVSGSVPEFALVRGQWIGELPDELRHLNLVEKLCISLFRHNNCVLQVKMGQRKLSGNAVVYSQPVDKFYDVLPPTKDELEQCLVVVFIGKQHPTLQDYRRTPLLIRKHLVIRALNWLKLNHRGYADVRIEPRNLDTYPADAPPVEVRYIRKEGRENPENVAVFDTETERGTQEGMCTFAVHGLSGAELVTMTREERILHALQHIDDEGHFISYGRSVEPQSMYHNPGLYPGLFPWLFPYGLGGFENKKLPPRLLLGRSRHIKRLISFHDLRFQTDEYFLPIIFSQEQIRAAVTGGHLVAKRKDVCSITRNLLSIDITALANLINRGKQSRPMKPENEYEQQCYDALTPIRSVDGHVQGSIASKRYQRNELHSLIMQRGLPYFFITFSPVDYKSPLCLYYCAGDTVDLDAPLISMPTSEERSRMIAANPVACSKFFHLMVSLFIDILLAPGSSKGGLFGPTLSYYGTVESQGRLTLHLHLLLWIKGSLSPNELKAKLLADTDGFRQKFFDWLDNTFQANFSTGPLPDVQQEVDRIRSAHPVNDSDKMWARFVEDPCCGLPPSPPRNMSGEQLVVWKAEMDFRADVIALFSNQHKHGMGCDWVEGEVCRARFPRFKRDEHEVEADTGFLLMKQREEMLNNFSPTMSLLMMCNHDISPLYSGSQLKPIVAYVTDYITKTPLKTHAIFESIKSILSMKDEILQGITNERDVSRKLLTRIVNAISSRQEIGAPMIAHYLQGFPDHYTNEKFKVVYWRTYDSFVVRRWEDPADDLPPDDEVVQIDVKEDSVVACSRLNDYLLRPDELEDWCLYDFLKFSYMKPMTEKESERAATYLINHESNPAYPRPPMLFRLGHTQFTTHRVQLLSRSGGEYILNLVGGTLPKWTENTELSDDYARVMLIFFHPAGWRTGRDLKTASESWKDCFRRVSFSERSRTAMSHFNTFYECKDSRFDFSIQRRKVDARKSTGMIVLDNYINEYASADTEQHEAMTAMPGTHLRDYLASITQSERLGQNMRRILNEMKEMTTFLSKGMSDLFSSVDEDSVCSQEEDSFPEKSSREWRKCLQVAKDKIRAARLGTLPATDTETTGVLERSTTAQLQGSSEGNVVIIDPASVNELCIQYSPHKFVDHSPSQIASSVLHDFTLNDGQERAYSLIISQLNAIGRPPLRMYLGGIGGTGKSQVIKSIIAYLAARNQSHRFIVMAPTGSAAALIDGSTYHSILGFGNLKTVNTDLPPTKVKEDLAGVDLIFLDEISMVSCEDFAEISNKLSKAFPLTNEPFGGKSMIVAGDFGQLPPGSPFTHPLYSGSIGVDPHRVKGKLQKPVYGKSFWHTFTTVVILTENMRLTGMSAQDQAYATALGNLRYKRCTPTDIALFRTRVVGIGVEPSEAYNAPFRYVSILTGINSHRDAINDTSSICFANERHLPLQSFYSKDSWTASASSEYLSNESLSAQEANNEYQKYLWTLPPAVTKNIPGRLVICKDMPVMLKYNEATELCATNGAEGIIHSWNEAVGPLGRKRLETVFVQLKNPPRNIKLPHLPVNIVPIPTASSAINIRLRDDKRTAIGRKQDERDR
ncbi:hypothetical protein NLI96_g3330 [Meripilus lineatus]|uniref:ATP-dependent DNA helicase n=1 Tax=Meripilus lineatus TaxID=2056292 RepID=A0AAD5VBQ7_9APHY|nr:hypothetical protein NLI96_g3330 [Physisporinus lineatus]